MDSAASTGMRLPLPPGPKGRQFRHLRERLGRYDQLLERLHEEYGGIVAFHTPFQHICAVFDPELVQQVLVEKRSSFEKGPGYKRTNVFAGPTIMTSDGEDHRRRRKLIQPSFHRKALVGYAEIMVEEADALQRGWRHGHRVDLADEMQRLTVNIAAAAFFGRDRGVDPRVVQEALKGIEWGFALSQFPSSGLLRRLPLPRNRQAERAFEALDREIYATIEGVRHAGQERMDVISLLVGAVDEEGEHRSFEDAEVRDEAYVILMAGHETTANGLTWTFHHLDRNPSVRARLEQELEEVLEGRPPTMADLEKLPYTGAVFDEALRLTPPIFYIGRRAVEDCRIGDYLIPKGMVVQTCLLPTQRDERHFPQAGRFRPERWLEEGAHRRPKFSYFPFGGGDRICIAGAFAKMEATFVLATLLQRWRIEAVSQEPPELATMVLYRMRGGLPATVHERVGRGA